MEAEIVCGEGDVKEKFRSPSGGGEPSGRWKGRDEAHIVHHRRALATRRYSRAFAGGQMTEQPRRENTA